LQCKEHLKNSYKVLPFACREALREDQGRDEKKCFLLDVKCFSKFRRKNLVNEISRDGSRSTRRTKAKKIKARKHTRHKIEEPYESGRSFP